MSEPRAGVEIQKSRVYKKSAEGTGTRVMDHPGVEKQDRETLRRSSAAKCEFSCTLVAL